MSLQVVERIRLAANATAINFGAIPQTGSDLYLVITARGTTTTALDAFTLEPNGSVPSSMTMQLHRGGPSRGTPVVTQETAFLRGGLLNQSDAPANTFASTTITINDYTSSVQKTVTALTGTEASDTASYLMFNSGTFASTAPITSLRLNAGGINGGQFAAGSTATLYTVTRGTVPLLQPKATGGSIVYAGGFWYHTFRASANFVPTESINAEFLLVAGGGGGGSTSGSCSGAGGGGGGVNTYSAALTPQTYGVIVGAGGGSSGQGTVSSVAGQSLTGGNGGGSGGGGGGAGGLNAGSGASGNCGGNGANGGNGPTTFTSWGAAASAGELSGGLVYFSGGGGSGSANGNGSSGGLGGGGGGGNGNPGHPGNGAANTGGGGGGRGTANFGNGGGSGGSGIVIIRYAA